MTSLFQLFPLFWRPKILVLIAISAIASTLEGLSIGFFLPLFAASFTPTITSSETMAKFVAVFQFFGLKTEPKTILSLMIGTIFLKALIQLVAAILQSRLTMDFYEQTVKKLIRVYFESDYLYFSTKNSSSLTQIAVNEAHKATIAMMRFVSFFSPVITISILFAIAAKMNLVATIAAGCYAVLVFFVLKLLASASRRASVGNTAATSKFSELLSQSLVGFKYLTATNSKPKLLSKITDKIESISSSQSRLNILSSLVQISSEPLVGIFLGGLIWHFTFNLNQSISFAIALSLIFYRLFKEFTALQTLLQSYSAVFGSVQATFQTIKEFEANKDTSFQIPSKTSEITEGCSIYFDQVSFHYPGRKTIADVSFRIEANETVAFVGESGSGKSTLIDLMTGLLRPESGTIQVNGKFLRHGATSAHRDKIGFVTQDNVLFEDTVAANISLWEGTDPASESFKQVVFSAQRAFADGFIQQLPAGYNTDIGERGGRLSGGQRQRISIARELYRNPKLLILDEATSALDSDAESRVHESIVKLKGKLTIVLVAHRLSTVRFADKIFVVRGGKIIQSGKYSELVEDHSGEFFRMCQAQGLGI